MAYVSMRKMLEDAREGGYAVAAINTVNYLTSRAVVDAAVSLGCPVIIQTSVKTVKQIGIEEMISFLKPLCEMADTDVAVHLDHCTDIEFAKKCMDAGWSSIMFDGSKTPLEKNIADTLEVKEYIKGRDITLEGEVGSIVGVEEDIVVHENDAAYATREDCERYLKETGVDFLAPAVGTAHGVYKGEIRLNYDLFREINEISPVPLVLHGGTGLSDEMFSRLIDLGASKVNISTALKIAYCSSMYAYSSANRDENNPLTLDDYVYRKIFALAEKHINFFTKRAGSIENE